MQAATDVLIVGCGPVGLQLALELQRRGVRHLAIDQRPRPEYFCKALGVTPRTQEVWDQCGVLDDALRRGTFMRGVESCVDQGAVSCESMPEGATPYGFLVLPQYDTEEILRRQLQLRGGVVQQGVRLADFEPRADGVRARLVDADGVEHAVDCRYVAGCDGAHSVVRKGLGIEYEGQAYAMRARYGDDLTIDAIVAPSTVAVDEERFPLLRDADGGFRAAYGATRSCLYLIRPDRYVAHRAVGHDDARLRAYLDRILLAR